MIDTTVALSYLEIQRVFRIVNMVFHPQAAMCDIANICQKDNDDSNHGWVLSSFNKDIAQPGQEININSMGVWYGRGQLFLSLQ